MEDYETAATNLQSAVTAPDLKLQQRAPTTSATPLYRQGEQTTEPKKIETWGKPFRASLCDAP
jgi:hypothetical protein